MRDSGALGEEEFALLTSRLLGGRAVPEALAPTSETRRIRD